MSLVWTVIGTVLELMFANFSFMAVIFAGAGMANGRTLSGIELGILNLSIFILPAVSVISAMIVIYLHWRGATASAYWWYAVPLVLLVLYLGFVTYLGKTA